MLRSAGWVLWLLTTLVEAFVVYLFIIQRLFRRFLLFNFYLLLSVTTDIARYVVVSHFGMVSPNCIYFYYLTETLVAFFLFLAVCELSVRLVGTKMPRGRVVLLSAAGLLAAVWASLAAAWSGPGRPVIHFVVELSRDIFFVCCLAILLLWIWKLRNDPQDWVAARLVGVLSVYFLVLFLIFGAANMTAHVPNFNNIFVNISSMVGAWLPIGCGFVLVSSEHK